MVELHEPNAAFDESAGQQAVAGETGGVAGAAIERQRGIGLALKVGQFGRAGLHAVGHLVAGNAGGDLWVASFGGSAEVQVAEGIEGSTLRLGANSGRSAQIQNGIARAPQRNPLVAGG